MTEIAIIRAGAERVDDVESLGLGGRPMEAVFDDAWRFYARLGLVPYSG